MAERIFSVRSLQRSHLRLPEAAAVHAVISRVVDRIDRYHLVRVIALAALFISQIHGHANLISLLLNPA